MARWLRQLSPRSMSALPCAPTKAGSQSLRASRPSPGEEEPGELPALLGERQSLWSGGGSSQNVFSPREVPRTHSSVVRRRAKPGSTSPSCLSPASLGEQQKRKTGEFLPGCISVLEICLRTRLGRQSRWPGSEEGAAEVTSAALVPARLSSPPASRSDTRPASDPAPGSALS